MGVRTFELEVRTPFRLDFTVWALRRRPHNAVDLWDGSTWRRSVTLGRRSVEPVELAVSQVPTRKSPRLSVSVRRRGAAPGAGEVEAARHLVTRMLGLEVDLSDFYALSRLDTRLDELAERFAGMRPPRFTGVFESLVNAVACQQLSLDVGIHLLNRLSRHFDPAESSARAPVFPSADQLARAAVAELRPFGFSGAKARTLVGLAHEVAEGGIDLGALEVLDDAPARELLDALPGIGRWSAEYALLRGLGRLQVLPGDDVGAQNSLRRRFGLSPDGGYEAVTELSKSWWPYGGLVYFHLLLAGLGEAGHLT